jgi:hypothetical protein
MSMINRHRELVDCLDLTLIAMAPKATISGLSRLMAHPGITWAGGGIDERDRQIKRDFPSHLRKNTGKTGVNDKKTQKTPRKTV